MAVLEVKELTKKYGEGESEVIALDHVSFSVERGEFVAIIGASGSGKSTLMNMIGGIDYPCFLHCNRTADLFSDLFSDKGGDFVYSCVCCVQAVV